MDSDSDDEFSLESFRMVRRHCPGSPSKKPRQLEGGDAVYVPTPIMAALSPDPPSSPMSGDAQSQPRAGTDQLGADAVAASMALELRSAPDLPPPRSESGPRRRRRSQPPYTVESIVDDFKRRQGGLVRALTQDEEAFFQKCDPGMQPLHLYGGTDGSWEVKPPELKLPPMEPEPTPGINILRDTMERHKWLQQVAVNCDAWLFSISRFAGSYITATERGRLFTIIAGLPTVQEKLLEEKRSSSPEANAVVEETEEVHYEKQKGSLGPDEANEVEEQAQEICHIEEQRSSGSTEANEVLEETEDDGTDDDDNSCASCYSRYNSKAFWISCNVCHKWYHGKCVNVTSSEAEHMERYECPDCCSDRQGHYD